MRLAMMNAEVGDDVMQEDPTVNELERIAAEMTGKEAAIFVPSGTFGNQLALLTHTKRGDEVVIKDDAHVVRYEAGASAVIAGVQLRTVVIDRSYLTWADISKFIRRGYDIHQPDTGMVEIQNSLGNGDVMPLEVMKEIHQQLSELKIPIHLDGARLFNAATALGVDAKEVAQNCDSVMFCLSKGLGAPVGSMLAGTNDFIFRARKNRKLMGGGMRQVGILAAAGLIALKENTKRLHIDHEHAKMLAMEFAKYPMFKIDPDKVKTNIFYLGFNTETDEIPNRFFQLLKENNVLVYPPDHGAMRFVTHLDVSGEDIRRVLGVIEEIARKLG
jgi:threonine aldolase